MKTATQTSLQRSRITFSFRKYRAWVYQFPKELISVHYTKKGNVFFLLLQKENTQAKA